MQDASLDRPTRMKLLPVGIALIAIPLIPALILVFTVRAPEGWNSRPDAVRPWAREAYERTLSPSTRRPLPALADLPSPALTIHDSGQELEITGSRADEFRKETCHELFFADANGTGTLPDGTRLTLEAIAVFLPSDTADGESRSKRSTRPEWVEPMTGRPFAGDPDAAWWKEKRVPPRDQPHLHLHVNKEGDLPIRWHAPEIFDARTQVRLNSVSSYSITEPHGTFWSGLDIWHQTVVEISVPFAFGPVEEQSLEMREGASVEFGTTSRVEVLRLLPGDVSLREWGGGSEGFRSLFHRSDARPGMPPQRTPILFVWPPPASVMIEVLSHDGDDGSLLHGNDGIANLTQTGADSAATSIRLRRFPRLGRAVFRVPKLPRLTEVGNLFAVPIPKTRISSESDWIRLVAGSVGGRAIHSGSGSAIPDTLFPMEVENTTPAKLLEEYERHLGKPVYFNESTFELGDRPPPGLLERIAEWWRGTGIGSLRRLP